MDAAASLKWRELPARPLEVPRWCPVTPAAAAVAPAPLRAAASVSSLPVGCAAALAAPAALTGLRLGRRRRRGRGSARAVALTRHAARWDVVESASQDLSAAVAEIASKTTAAVSSPGPPPRFALLTVPAQWGGELAAATQQLKAAGALPGTVPLVGLHSGDTVRLGLARGDGGDALPFAVNKEQLSQAGKGLALENPIPGVPDGAHGSVLLFADPKVPGALTRNLLESLDARYPKATKGGVVVIPGKVQESAAAAAPELDWEPEKGTGRQLRTRDRSDGHGWIRGDPTVDSTNEGGVVETISVEFGRRPFGVKRYSPCLNGNGAMILDMQEKGRYKGDAMGQCADKGVKLGMVVKSINGEDMRARPFEDIMDLLNDQGIMDPDSKSAASWGEGGKQMRQPLAEAPVPMTVEFVAMSGGGGGGSASLALNGEAKKDVVLGLALPGPSSCSLDLFGCQPMGPRLEVAKAGANPDGGFAVDGVVVNGKAMPAAMALKGYAKAAGLSSMQGICVGMQRPQGADGGCQAGQWAVYPMAGVTPQGGLVLRCKGPAAEGLAGSDQDLKGVQFFAPGAGSLPSGGGAGAVAFAASPQALQAVPAGTFGVMGAAVIGAAGARSTGADGAPTALHRQAAATFALQ